ncbi:MAG: GAF domain-containing protein [Thermodesulfovibrionales bacterium]|nr:GAF domain-containing protein [Thermodesulfovibrionales bacterium]
MKKNEEDNSLIYNNPKSLSYKVRNLKGYFGIARLFIIPIIRKKNILATIVAANKTDDYTEEDIKWFSFLADSTKSSV